MKQTGLAEKTFAELGHMDMLYYIDPKKPTEIGELTIKSVKPWEANKGYVAVEYFRSSDALSMTTSENQDVVPTQTIYAKASDKRILTLTMPPTVYFTNKRALEKFMGNR